MLKLSPFVGFGMIKYSAYTRRMDACRQGNGREYSGSVPTHVETVCLLSNRKRKPDSYVRLSLDMEDYYRIKDAENSFS